ncbi:ATP-dependent zinc metalloprotease FtsH [Prevotella lacticifex]|uniref:ATP-dependent zinc metalloprotease FtsH n=2 Tax=Prevotella lacticifex TaxID=2854755 RepID=A0A9R1CZ80_9BACT|nr:ATP-dependent zinc metalloprotease FtsH [Prevotella lacticifex]GJG36617.1 cell division protein FtsH [Prevotella lacticifex]GJG38476.1 cell division protein FtsH [Prevotella lacticifex]GJG42841.1 cell division protein FtsH [Prevotella lacticifex]GJG44833.1 cell division protein FtsH [Prevotella lacticifex]GJG49192.1 cell division protein FtsH [Prevotella lacticifex]
MEKKQNQRPQQSWLNWNTFFWVMLLLLIINSFVYPKFGQPTVKDTDYATFISYVDHGKVNKVVVKDDIIYFTVGKEQFKTVEVDDPQLSDRLLKAKSPNKSGRIEFTKTLPQKNSPLLDFIIWWILPALIFFGLWQWGAKRMMKGGAGGGGFLSLGKSGAKVYAERDVKTTFADVAGQDEAKETLKEIVDFLHNPKKYTRLGAKLPKGALLVGPPGTGKTLIARAVAGEAHVPFFSISGSAFVQMFVGMGAAKVRDLFQQAQQKAPCIIFIDEIDAIGKSRDQAMGNDEREQTLNQLLTEMDGFDATKGLVILAATNRPETLDKALLRPGRFDRRIIMELPDLEGRKAILQVHLKDVKHSDIDLDKVGRATAGSSGADIANIVNEAALRAVRLNKNEIDTDDLLESVETVIAGEQKKGAVISPEEKRIISYHEIGHAMVAACQSHSAPVEKITIVPRTSGALGYTMQVDAGEKHLMSKEEMLNRIATLTGGRAAEEVMCHTVTTGASNDIEKATQLAREMITIYGMSDKYGMMQLEEVRNRYLGGNTSLTCSAETARDIDKEVARIIHEAHEKATRIITEHKAEMDAATAILLKKETITGEEFMKVLEDNSPEPVAE